MTLHLLMIWGTAHSLWIMAGWLLVVRRWWEVQVAVNSRQKPDSARGARTTRAPWRQQVESYLHHHRKVARDSAQRLWRAPIASLMTWTVMGVALALPVALLLLLTSLEGVSSGWQNSARITAYLTLDVPVAQARELAAEINGDGRVLSVELIERDAALAEFQTTSGLGAALDFLDDNPLP